MGPARIGTWYLRWDKGEIFQVTGYNNKSGMIEIKTFDGDSDEIDEQKWAGLPLGLADPPEDWTGPVDTVDVVDFGSCQRDGIGEDVAESPRQPEE